MSTAPITSILVANRGEIARRVFRTAKAMGIRTTAIYVDADADAPFVREADMAVRVESYMDVDDIVAVAQSTGAESIHPGYGFLSENAAFAAAVVDAGLRWIGPSPDVIASMGDKLEAKKRAVAADVPTLPSSEDLTASEAIGFPILVKASAGGGGKGMRVVNAAADLTEAIAAAKREALNGFGNDTVFLERYVPKSRHIEIQIMGDTHGTVVAHGERECSIQRRHQKIIEEAPSPGISPDVREQMEAAAIRLGTEMGYTSAGTVEFLVDDETGEFFFLEVNTRLQVEHPVTEEARSIDLVREQIQIANGALATPTSVASLAAIEVRLYAEDPSNNFLPATGTLSAFLVHPDDEQIRWDVGVEQGSAVTIDFDPMLGKVIASGPNRTEAALRLATALQRLHLGGVVTNRDFLVNVLRSPEFLAGDTTTDFIDRVAPSPALDLDDNGVNTALIAAAMWLRGRNRSNDPHWGNLPAGFRTGRMPPTAMTLTASAPFFAPGDEGAIKTVAYQPTRNGSLSVGVAPGHVVNQGVLEISLADTATVLTWAPDHIDLQIGRVRLQHQITAAPPGDDRIWVQMPMGTVELVVAPKFVIPGSAGPSGGFIAPMPGVVLEVRAEAGASVAKGDTLIVLEAMKMEHHMTAPADGIVADVFVAAGDQVTKDAVLLTMQDVESNDLDTGDNSEADANE